MIARVHSSMSLIPSAFMLCLCIGISAASAQDQCAGYENAECIVGESELFHGTAEELSNLAADAVASCEESEKAQVDAELEKFREALANCRAGATAGKCSAPRVGIDGCPIRSCAQGLSCDGEIDLPPPAIPGSVTICEVDPTTGAATATAGNCAGKTAGDFDRFVCYATSSSPLPKVACPPTVDAIGVATIGAPHGIE